MFKTYISRPSTMTGLFAVGRFLRLRSGVCRAVCALSSKCSFTMKKHCVQARGTGNIMLDLWESVLF